MLVSTERHETSLVNTIEVYFTKLLLLSIIGTAISNRVFYLFKTLICAIFGCFTCFAAKIMSKIH